MKSILRGLSMKHIIFISFILFSCQNLITMPDDAAMQFGRWFVSPAKAQYDSLCAYKSIVQKLDSLVTKSRNMFSGPCGKFTSVVSDTFGSFYTLGWETPATIRRDTLYPLIVYLHGGTGTMLTTKGELAYDMLSALGDTFNLFLASPSANRVNPWWSPAGISRILQTVRFMTLRYPINPDKIFLAGVSDGAAGCYAAANTICSPFAGFIAVSGYGGMLVQLGMNLYPGNIMQRPILNINAGQDRIYPIENVRQFLGWLTANGVSVESKEYPDEQHGFDYRDKEYGHLANIIRTWTRPKETRSISWTFVPDYPNLPTDILQWEFIQKTSEQTCKASWDGDTLKVKTKGMRGVTLAFPEVKSKDITVMTNDLSARKISAFSGDVPFMLTRIQHHLFPGIPPETSYRIEIP
jgi:hypothetical protein